MRRTHTAIRAQSITLPVGKDRMAGPGEVPSTTGMMLCPLSTTAVHAACTRVEPVQFRQGAPCKRGS